MRCNKPTVNDLTKQIVRSTIEANLLRRNTKFIDECVKRVREQIIYENQRLTANLICKSDGKSGAYIKILDGLKKHEIAERLETEFGDPAFMESIRCAIDFILDSPDDEACVNINSQECSPNDDVCFINKKTCNIKSQTSRMKSHEYIDNLVRFGAESVNGYAIKAGFSKTIGTVNDHPSTSIDDIFMMKCPRSPYKSNEMTHEVVIGLEGLNAVREECPHFSYTYAAIKAGPALFDKDKTVIGWANQAQFKVGFAYYEIVKNSKEINKVTTPEELILYYTQALMGLNIANKRCKFTHYDAHDDNALIRHVSSEPFYLKYDFKGRTIYLRSLGCITTFIDYGMSHIQTRDKTNIGILDPDGFFRANGTPHDTDNIIGDAYKLICMLLLTFLENEQEELVDTCLSIIGYFYDVDKISDIDMVTIIDKQWDARFNVRKELTGKWVTDENGNKVFAQYWDIEELIERCFDLARRYNSDNVLDDGTVPTANIFGIHKLKPTLKNMKAELLELTTNAIEVPDCYELYSSRDKDISRSLIAKLNANPQLCLEREEAICSKYIQYHYDELFSSLDHKSKEDILEHLDTSKSNIRNVFGLINIIIEIDDKLTELRYCVQLNPIYSSLLSKLTDKYTRLTAQLKKYSTYIISGELHLRELIFGRGVDTPNEIEEKQGTKNSLYEIWDNYRNAVASLKEANIIRK